MPDHSPDRANRAEDTTLSSSTSSTDEIDEKTDSPSGGILDPEAKGSSSQASLPKKRKSSVKPPIFTDDGRRIISEEECAHLIGYAWSTRKKWTLLSGIFLVQLSMNFNTSVYPSVVAPLAEHFHVSEQAARVGHMLFLVMYAFGCELWAPWSEEFGRWITLQLSMGLVNIWQILAALAPNYGSVMAARALGGISCAGGSVTIGMVADLFEPHEQQWAVAFVVLSSVGGTSIGPVIGGPIQEFLPWYWNFWVQLIFGASTQFIHLFMPESRATIIMDREAKRRRTSGEDPNVWGPNEVKNPRVSNKEVIVTCLRPFQMFLTEPIVLSCSLLSGFSDALIFTFQEGFNPVFEQWGFGVLEIAWAFIAINVGYLVAYASYIPWFRKTDRIIKKNGRDAIIPEERLKWLLWLAPLETIGLFGFAWSSWGPPVPWVMPMIFSGMIAVANYAIYMSTIDYMVAAYGVYSASATGGNGFARDFMAGISAMYAAPLYENIPPKSLHLELASTILACLALVVTAPVYLIYWKGPVIRERSKFAQSLDQERKDKDQARLMDPDTTNLEV